MLKRFLSAPIDWVTFIIPIILTITGVITIYTITYNQDKSGLATDQISFAVMGLILMSVTMFSDYRWFKSIANIIYVIGIVGLILLLPPIASQLPFTLKVFGAYRWLDFGFFQLQPGEIFKIIAAIFSAKILHQHIGQIDAKKTLFYILLALIPVLLILMQPDLGTASVVLAVFLTAFVASRPSGRVIIGIVALAAILTPLLWANLQPYQKNRVETLFNPTADPQGQGYNVRQSIIAIGSGGLTGRGFGQGSQTVLNFLPVVHTDFIFSGFAEATGFIGSVTLLLLYLILIFRSLPYLILIFRVTIVLKSLRSMLNTCRRKSEIMKELWQQLIRI